MADTRDRDRLSSGPAPPREQDLETQIQTLREQLNTIEDRLTTENNAAIAERDRIINERDAYIQRGRHINGDWNAILIERDMPWWRVLRRGGFSDEAYKEAAKKAAKLHNYSILVARPGLRFIEEDDFFPEVNNSRPTRNFRPELPFRFMDLFDESNPNHLHPSRFVEILAYVLVKPGGIDVLTRFDPFAEYPFRAPVGSLTRLPHRFYWGDSDRCSINAAYDPNRVLATLRVSRLWLETGAAIFYGLNTFRFSSFGELGSFLKGIGAARRQRIQEIELTWIGSLMWRTNGSSARTQPLMLLPSCLNLKVVKVFIDETRNQRKNEVPHRAEILRDATEGEMKAFCNRALPTLQGLPEFRDCLRGLKLVEFYDYSTKSYSRVKIQDQDFMEQVRSLVTRPKRRSEARAARAENLDRLLENMDDMGEWRDSVILGALRDVMTAVPTQEQLEEIESNHGYEGTSDNDTDEDSESSEHLELSRNRPIIDLEDDEGMFVPEIPGRGRYSTIAQPGTFLNSRSRSTSRALTIEDSDSDEENNVLLNSRSRSTSRALTIEDSDSDEENEVFSPTDILSTSPNTPFTMGPRSASKRKQSYSSEGSSNDSKRLKIPDTVSPSNEDEISKTESSEAFEPQLPMNAARSPSPRI